MLLVNFEKTELDNLLITNELPYKIWIGSSIYVVNISPNLAHSICYVSAEAAISVFINLYTYIEVKIFFNSLFLIRMTKKPL